MNHALDYLELSTPTDDPVEITAKKAAIPYVEGLVEDFDNRWGGGESILVYREGMEDIRRDSGRSTSKKTAQDPRTK